MLIVLQQQKYATPRRTYYTEDECCLYMQPKFEITIIILWSSQQQCQCLNVLENEIYRRPNNKAVDDKSDIKPVSTAK